MTRFSRVFFAIFALFTPIFFHFSYILYIFFGTTHLDLAGARVVFGSEGYAALSLSQKWAKLVGGKFLVCAVSITGRRPLDFRGQKSADF